MDVWRSRSHAHASCSSASPAARPAALLRQQLMQRRPQRRASGATCRAERKEYYDFKDMPPLPLGVKRIYIPDLDYTVVDKATEEQRLASLAIFSDIFKDDQYGARLSRKSAITALCMYDRDDVDGAARRPGDYPNIDLLQRIYKDGLDLEFVVEEFGQPGAGAQ